MMISDFVDQARLLKISTVPKEAPRRRRRGGRNRPKPLGCRQTEIQDLNDDCLIHIFSFLPVIDRVRIQRVCKRWNETSLLAWQTLKELNLQEDFWGISNHKKIIIHRCIFLKILELCGRFLNHIDVSKEVLGRPYKVRIESCKAVFQMIADTCPNIRSINIGIPSSESAIEFIAHHFPKLTSVTVQIPRYDYGSSLAQLFFNHSNLLNLKLIESKLSSTCLLNLIVENLKELHLIYCTFETTPSIVNVIYRLKALHSLSIVYCYSLSEWEKEVLQAVGSLTDLEKFELMISNNCYASINIDFISYLTNLKELSLGGNEVANDEVLDRVSSNCRNIKKMKIANSVYLTNASISYIANLPHLEHLYLNSLNNLTCKNLDKLFQIKYLSCASCPQLKNEGFIYLIASSEKIKSINIDDCEGISEDLIINANNVASEKLNLVIDNSKINNILVTNIHSLAKAENQIIKKFEKVCIDCYKEPVKNCSYCCKKVEVF